jgi:hypothetical protein
VVRSCVVDDKEGWTQQVCGGVGACCRLSRTELPVRTEAGVVDRTKPGVNRDGVLNGNRLGLQ